MQEMQETGFDPWGCEDSLEEEMQPILPTHRETTDLGCKDPNCGIPTVCRMTQDSVNYEILNYKHIQILCIIHILKYTCIMKFSVF